jgi:hypothetical protein
MLLKVDRNRAPAYSARQYLFLTTQASMLSGVSMSLQSSSGSQGKPALTQLAASHKDGQDAMGAPVS